MRGLPIRFVACVLNVLKVLLYFLPTRKFNTFTPHLCLSNTVVLHSHDCIQCRIVYVTLVLNYASYVSCSSSTKTGKYGDQLGLSVCTNCDSGRTSLPDSEDVSDCTPCGSGTFAASAGSASCGTCGEGTHAADVSGNSVSSAAVQCADCEPGRHQDSAGQSECAACLSGHASNTTGLEDCFICTAGKYGADGSGGEVNTAAEQCAPCSRGKFATGTANSHCDNCPQGSYASTTGKESCDTCLKGGYTATDGLVAVLSGAVQCADCPIGRYSGDDNHGSGAGYFNCMYCQSGKATNSVRTEDSCTACIGGKFSADAGGNPAASEGITCDDCPKGTFDTDSLQSRCNDCPRGHYQNITGQSECLACSRGTHANITGQSECLECELGKYEADEGAFNCENCHPGFAAPATGLTFCAACGEGKFSNGTEPGSDGTNSWGSLYCEDCPAGRHQEHRNSYNCSACHGGYAQHEPGQLTCYSCTAGTYSNGRELRPSGTYDGGSTLCQDCEKGKYGHNPHQTDCLWCQAGKAMPSTGQTDCDKCGSGRFSEDIATDCEDCAFYEYASGDENVDCESCFSMDSGIGLAYPTQCISSWVILISICVLPCIIIYSYRCYMAGHCDRKERRGGITTVVLQQRDVTPTATPCEKGDGDGVQLKDITAIEGNAL